jgi:hypothetical protein
MSLREARLLSSVMTLGVKTQNHILLSFVAITNKLPMKKLLITITICGALAACQSNRATNANDSASTVKPDTAGKMTDSATTSKPDTPGKSDGAGTGPAYGSGSKSPDSAKNGKKP